MFYRLRSLQTPQRWTFANRWLFLRCVSPWYAREHAGKAVLTRREIWVERYFKWHVSTSPSTGGSQWLGERLIQILTVATSLLHFDYNESGEFTPRSFFIQNMRLLVAQWTNFIATAIPRLRPRRHLKQLYICICRTKHCVQTIAFDFFYFSILSKAVVVKSKSVTLQQWKVFYRFHISC